MDTKDPTIHASLMPNLQNRTQQRHHDLKGTYWDKYEDKTQVTRKTPDEVKHMSDADWCLLVDSWSTSKKQVHVFVHLSLPPFQFQNVDCR